MRREKRKDNVKYKYLCINVTILNQLAFAWQNNSFSSKFDNLYCSDVLNRRVFHKDCKCDNADGSCGGCGRDCVDKSNGYFILLFIYF